MAEKLSMEDEASQQSGNFYSLYREDDLSKDVKPCKARDLLRFSNAVDILLMGMGCFFALGSGISLIFYSQPLKDLIMAFDPHSNPEQILANLTNAIKSFAINSIFVFLNASLMTITMTISSQRQLIRVRNLYFKSLLKQEFAWYDRNKPESVCSQMYLQTQKAQNSLVESITSILSSFSMGFGGIIFAFSHGWKMAIVMACFLPVMMLTNYISTRLGRKWQQQFVAKTGDMNANVIQIFQNIKTVKYLGGEDYEIKRFSEEVQNYSKQWKQYRRKTTIASAVGFFCIIFNYALGFWYGAKLVADRVYNTNSGQTYDVGDVVSIFFCIYVSNLNINGLPGHLTNFYNSRIALSQIIKIIDRKPRQSEGTETCNANIQEIQFRNISFQYSQPLFNQLSLTIKKGVIGIVGSSGNGKSTLLYLLMKFYEPFKGDIYLRNSQATQNLKNIESKSLRNIIGYVGQEPVLLGRTIREVLGNDSLKTQSIWKALSICCADEFVKDIGLDSSFKALSGGQKQRIAIARAILRQPQILILDEGTSALDGINEKRLLRNLKERSNIQFIIMIAHRTETLAEASTIIKVEKGGVQFIRNDQELDHVIYEQVNEEKEQQQKMSQQQHIEQRKDGEVQQPKASFKFKSFLALLRLNQPMMKYYIFGIISAMLLGVIFPSFSYIITRLCSLVTDIKYATTDEEIQSLRNQASQISLLLMFISLASILLTIVKGNSFLNIGENIGMKTKIYAFSNFIKKEMMEIQSLGKTDITHVINNNTSNVKEMVSGLIENISEHIFTLAVGLAIAFIYCWQITLVSLFLIPMSLVGGKLQQKFLGGLTQNSDKVYRKTHQIVSQSILHSRTIKSLNLQDQFYEKYRVQQSKGFRKSIRDSIFSGITLGISQCLISGMLSLIYYIGGLLVENQGVRIVDLFTATYAIMFSGVQAGCNIGFVGNIASNSYGAARFFDVLNITERELERDLQVKDIKNELVQQLQDESILGESADQVKGNIEFKNVNFKYLNRGEYLFKNLSFRVNEGQRVAIVGQSGSGKTTIADLIFKIYRPEEGEVLLDGISTDFYSKSNLSQQLAIVSQEPALFNRSIIENIRYNSQASINDVKEAAKIANAFEFIESGGFGLEEQSDECLKAEDTSNWQRLVGSRGSLLSGGQKQRVALARAIIRKPKLMVFDEATSALDNQTEQSLLQNMSKALHMTQIIIAHRHSTIRSCNRIIVLRQGKVVQSGDYEGLIELRGEFANLVNALQNQNLS